MPEDAVLFRRADAVATIILNRPDKLNAIDDDVRQGLAAALDAVEHDRDIRVAVITGAGRGFCAGGDIQTMIELKKGYHSATFRGYLDAGHTIARKIRLIPKPIVASVNGPAAGAGMNLALACDLRIASDQATFTQAFSKIGLHPDWSGTFSLPRLVGLGKALEIFWLGEPIAASEAQRLGLVNFVTPHDALEAETGKLAGKLAAAAPLPMALLKQSLYERIQTELDRVMDQELAAQMKCFASEDFSEGLRAFTEKRAPKFRGN
ncbi:MAG TPA: enoyl-CoA hydratase [Terriglobia bacterium]|jgi:2-(1,2-epoxy-1,2-dihydrophenyl)acetyl-CoA isomerase|nr:enoyl-CoA hydratase [Terriglobia bacterium]